MKAYEAAKKLGMKSKEFTDKYNLKSHLTVLQKELENELFGKKELKEDVVEFELPARTPPDIKLIRTGINGCGNKSCYWEWRHLLDG